MIKNGVEFEMNEHNKPTYEERRLGSLKWGHPALIAWFGSHYASKQTWDDWFKTELKSFAQDPHNHVKST